jgi:Protein of unknown function (DUF2550)
VLARAELGTAWFLAVLLALAVAAAGGLAIRRILLGRGGGTVECGLRRGPDQGWRLGIAAYEPSELRWYDAFGVLLKPREVFARRPLAVVSQRAADDWETARLGEGMVVVECKPGELAGAIELAMSEAALTGFLAWLESSPPAGSGMP